MTLLRGDGLAFGNLDRVLKALKHWEACGVDRVNFILNCMELIPQEKMLASLRVFAKEVRPHFQDENITATAPTPPVGVAAKWGAALPLFGQRDVRRP